MKKNFTLEDANLETDKDLKYTYEELLDFLQFEIPEYFTKLNDTFKEEKVNKKVTMGDISLGKDEQSLDVEYEIKAHKWK